MITDELILANVVLDIAFFVLRALETVFLGFGLERSVLFFKELLDGFIGSLHGLLKRV